MEESILINYLKNKASQEECIQVEAWSEASAANKKLLEELYYVLFLADRQAAISAIDVERSLAKFKKNLKKQEFKYKKVFRWKRYAVHIAAFLVGALFTGGAFWLYSQDNASSYMVSTEPGQRAQVVLPDGTRVWLNSSTQLTYKKEYWRSARNVDLAGEAYFEVKRNEHVPFTVRSKNIKTSVLGTKFNVRAHSGEERVVTTLLCGSVCVNAPDGTGEGFLLKPGQTLDVDAKTYKAELIEYAQPKDVLLWIKGELRFEQATLADIVSTLEKHFDVRFKFANERLKNERFTCKFSTDDNIAQILAVISLTKRLTYQKEGKLVKLMNN